MTTIRFGKPRQPMNYGKVFVTMTLNLSPDKARKLVGGPWHPKCSIERLLPRVPGQAAWDLLFGRKKDTE